MDRRISIIFTKPPKPTPQASERENARRQDITAFGTRVLPLMWAKVLQQTGIQTVDVELVSGLKLRNVPVASSRWVKKGTVADDSKATGRKDLPQAGSKVLVAFVDGVIDSPLVLPVSGFSILAKEQTAEILQDGQRDLVVDVDEYGWKLTHDKATGKIIYESPDQSSDVKVSITVDVEGKSIVIEQDVDSSHKNTVTMDAGGMELADVNGNTLKMVSGKVTINDNLEVDQ